MFALIAVDGIATCSVYILAAGPRDSSGFWYMLDMVFAIVALVALFGGGVVMLGICILKAPARFDEGVARRGVTDEKDEDELTTIGNGGRESGNRTTHGDGGTQAGNNAGQLVGGSAGREGQGFAKHVAFLMNGTGMWRTFDRGGMEHMDAQEVTPARAVPNAANRTGPAPATGSDSDSDDDADAPHAKRGLARFLPSQLLRPFSRPWARRVGSLFDQYAPRGKYFLLLDILLTVSVSSVKGLYYAGVLTCLEMVIGTFVTQTVTLLCLAIIRPFVAPFKNIIAIVVAALLSLASIFVLIVNTDDVMDLYNRDTLLLAAQQLAIAALYISLIAMLIYLCMSLYELFEWVGFQLSEEGRKKRHALQQPLLQVPGGDEFVPFHLRTTRVFIPSELEIPETKAESDAAIERQALIAAGMVPATIADSALLAPSVLNSAANGPPGMWPTVMGSDLIALGAMGGVATAAAAATDAKTTGGDAAAAASPSSSKQPSAAAAEPVAVPLPQMEAVGFDVSKRQNLQNALGTIRRDVLSYEQPTSAVEGGGGAAIGLAAPSPVTKPSAPAPPSSPSARTAVPAGAEAASHPNPPILLDLSPPAAAPPSARTFNPLAGGGGATGPRPTAGEALGFGLDALPDRGASLGLEAAASATEQPTNTTSIASDIRPPPQRPPVAATVGVPSHTSMDEDVASVITVPHRRTAKRALLMDDEL